MEGWWVAPLCARDPTIRKVITVMITKILTLTIAIAIVVIVITVRIMTRVVDMILVKDMCQALENLPLTNYYTLGTAPPPPLSNSWIISIIWLYRAINRTPNIDC